MAASNVSGGMVWSAALASRLPASPMKEGGIVSEQPRSPITHTPKEIKQKEDENLTPSCNEMKQHFFEHRLLLEYKLLGEQQIPGVYVLPSQQTLCEWHGVLFIHAGPWKGGIYRFSLVIPDEYPQARPMFRFRTPINHPYVKHKNGQVNLYRVMYNWDPSSNYLHEVISSVRKSFLTPEVWECEDKDEEKRLLTTFRRSAMDSAVIVSKNQDDLNGPENLLRLVDAGDEVVAKARDLIHSKVLPMDDEGSSMSTSVLDQLTNSVSQIIGKVMGSN